MEARHVRVTGRVQGVGYRAWAQRTAEALGVTGWVRNRPEGSVEAVVAGPGEAVEAMIAAMRDGPAAARVAAVEVADADPPPEDGFRIVR